MRTIIKRPLQLAAILLAMVAALATFNVLRYLVFWSPTERVSFQSINVLIAGTLIKPAVGGVYPAVIILHGSGPEDRSEPSYRITANTLVRSGFAVLLYDKRGVGDSGGDFESAHYRDFIDDAVAAVRYMADRPDIDAQNIGLQGNSESGWFTPEVAQVTGRVAFIFNRAGPPLAWMDNVIWEVRNDLSAAGIAEADLEPLLASTLRRWRYYIAAGTDARLVNTAERDAINAELKTLRETVPFADQELPEQLAPYDAESYAGYAADFSYDPRPFLELIDVPMIYVFGEQDVNIPTKRSVEFLRSFREQYNKNIDIVVMEDVGHALANWTGVLTGGFVPPYLDLLASWPREHLVTTASRSP